MSHPAQMPLAITMGDAAGIAPEIIAKAVLHSPQSTRGCFVAAELAGTRAAHGPVPAGRPARRAPRLVGV